MVVVFRARSHTLNFGMILKSYNVAYNIINTPRGITVACSIAIKFNPASLNIVKNIVARRKWDSFAGIYQIENNGKVIKIF